jgi:hypothetical protein
MKAIIVAVDYSDILAVTLPYNRHHFDEVWIVTTLSDLGPVVEMAEQYHCKVFPTNAFYRDGAIFNKFLALEEGLDAMGREGWLCLLDADILLPRNISTKSAEEGESDNSLEFYEEFRGGRVWRFTARKGYLYSPLRRMHVVQPLLPFPQEDQWGKLPHHPLHRRWPSHYSGYCMIFHADDPVLGKPPWHRVDGTHAGGADTEFMQRWSEERRIRPSWECLHLGESGKNWRGRVTPRIGTA